MEGFKGNKGYNEPIDFGSHKGVKLDRKAFEEAIAFYYDMMGWDSNGKPKESTLYDYDLDRLCEN